MINACSPAATRPVAACAADLKALKKGARREGITKAHRALARLITALENGTADPQLHERMLKEADAFPCRRSRDGTALGKIFAYR